jgi:hypothetical protein
MRQQVHWWQDTLADFTLGLVLVSACQAILFLVQLRLIRQSLEPAKAAAEAAKESARAAHRAIDEAEKRDKVLERAYLWPGFGLLIYKDAARFGIHLGIRNTGRTAGIIKTVHYALGSEKEFQEFEGGKIITYKVFKDREDDIIPDPGAEARSGVWHRLSEMPKVSWGWITYVDVFGTIQRQGWKHNVDNRGRTESLPGCYTYEPWNIEHGEKPSDQELLPPDAVTKLIPVNETA